MRGSKGRRSSSAAFALALFMGGAGFAHFAFPQAYERIVPRLLGDPAFWVRWSGIAEIACAGLLAGPRTRRMGALATMGVLAVVFPANVKMALDGGIAEQPLPLGSAVVAWARLPLQVPILVWAWKVAAAAGDRPPPPRKPPTHHVIQAVRRPRRPSDVARYVANGGSNGGVLFAQATHIGGRPFCPRARHGGHRERR